MKKIVTFLFAGFLTFAYAQLPVSRTLEKKRVVLEEFTGKSCPACPHGHKAADALKQADPENVFLINIHTGSYANGTPNYRTAFGAALANQSGLTGYPNATINRHLFGGSSTAMGARNYASNAAIIKTQDAYVNVAAEASVDVQTRVLTINVEAYYTANSPTSSNFLNVAITQNGILGPQSGAANNPSSIDPVTGEYTHDHMLRHLVTGQWGEEITTVSQGSLVQKTYTYTLPATIGDVPVDLTKLDIVVFVAESRQEIINGNKAKPTLTGYVHDRDAVNLNVVGPENSCSGIVSTTSVVRNLGRQNITSMEFRYNIDGGAEYQYLWSADTIKPAETKQIQLPNIGYAVNDSNTINVKIEKVNGLVDQNPSNNTESITIKKVKEFQTNKLTIDVVTDRYGSEVSWKLLGANGNVIDSIAQGTYANGASRSNSYLITLPAFDCYEFIIQDSYNDGMGTTGSVTIKDNVGNIIHKIEGNSYTAKSTFKFATLDNNGNTYGNGDGSSVNPEPLVAINTIENLEVFNVYPSPAQNTLYVNVAFANTTDVVEINVQAIDGKIVKTIKENNVDAIQDRAIDVSTLQAGIYFVEIKSNKGKAVRKVVIRN